MKKVLLINPNTNNVPYPVPPLGLCLMAAVLERNYEVQIFDATFRGARGLEARIQKFAPDYVGVGIRNIDNAVMDRFEFYVDTLFTEFIEPIRRTTSAPLILGGSGFTILAQEIMAMFDADYGIVGEGELSFPELIRALDNGKNPTGIPRVISRNFWQSASKRKEGFANLKQIPFSRIDLLVDYIPYKEKSAYPIQIKRGCLRNCVYCTYPAVEGRKFRERSVRHVVDELEETRERIGDITFEFVDSTFNDPPGLAEAVCREIIQRGLKVRLRTMGINPRHISSELLRLMKGAGFAQIDITPDSASSRVLFGLQKGFTRSSLEKSAELIRQLGIPAMWFFVFGGPGETEDSIHETFDFIDRFVYEEDLVHITEGLRIYPATPLHDLAVRENVVDPGDSLLRSKFYISPSIGYEQLTELILKAVDSRPNCLRATEAVPPPEMMKTAVEMRLKHNLTEPMFRTLLRLRRKLWNERAYFNRV